MCSVTNSIKIGTKDDESLEKYDFTSFDIQELVR